MIINRTFKSMNVNFTLKGTVLNSSTTLPRPAGVGTADPVTFIPTTTSSPLTMSPARTASPLTFTRVGPKNGPGSSLAMSGSGSISLAVTKTVPGSPLSISKVPAPAKLLESVDATKGSGATSDATKGSGATSDATKGSGSTSDATKGSGATSDGSSGPLVLSIFKAKHAWVTSSVKVREVAKNKSHFLMVYCLYHDSSPKS